MTDEGILHTPHGEVSTLKTLAVDSSATLVLAHGAGANIAHGHMTAIAEALAAAGISTLRFNFPYMERGGGRVDRVDVCTDCFAAALAEVQDLQPNEVLLAGGHSFGGRMSTHYAAAPTGIMPTALALFSFPLHPSGKPGTSRATHLAGINIPMLFLTGTRDKLAERDLMGEAVESLPNASVHWIDTADHSFKPLKRQRTASESVYDEAARVLRDFVDRLA